MSKLKFAILGTGKIAQTMAKTVNQLEDVELFAVASRSLERAKGFSDEFKVKNAYGSYEELVQDEEINLVYIATPHSEHCANTKLCLNSGKHVLCEKAFAVNEIEAAEMISLAKEKNLLLTEALWVRFMPMVTTLKQVLASGIIGSPMTLTANLGYLIDNKKRLMDPSLAGGALLDVGVYTLTFAAVAFGDEIETIDSSVIKTETGVDAQNSITLTYCDGRMAILNSSLRVLSDRQGIIYGTKGYVIVENINNFESIRVYNDHREMIEEYLQPQQISGYEYQVLACMEAISKGRIECQQMTHQDTLNVMRIMDTLRQQWKIKYPMES